jgi:alpha-tubulin suppressor-like RCC1 family protein
MTTLIYPANKPGCMNVLLVDSSVRDAQIFIDSVNANTFPILYSSSSTKDELLDVLQNNFTTLDRIGLVFYGSGAGSAQFLDNAPFFISPETNPYSENVEFIINVISHFQVKNIDYLACNTLKYPSWVDYYAILTQETSVIVGASNDQTGNIQYGGDWTMESTSEDIEFIYFTESIEYYSYLLDYAQFTMLVTNNTIYGAGDNTFGALGLGNNTTPILTLTPADYTGAIAGKRVKYITSGVYHAVAIMTDDTVWGAGYNGLYGQLGLQGLDNSNNAFVFTQMLTTGAVSSKTAKYISCGSNHTIILMTDGTVWGAGDNSVGQLGLTNATSPVTTFTQMVFTGAVSGKIPKYVSSGQHTMILMEDGTVWGTGYNGLAALGIGNTTTPITVLTQLINTTGRTPAYIAVGAAYTIILMTDYTIWGVGKNNLGQLGINNTNSPITTFTQMIFTGTVATKTPKAISSGLEHVNVLMTDGTIWGTGNNSSGQLGLTNTTSPRTTLQPMIMTPIGSRTPEYIVCEYYGIFVLMTDKTVWGTGLNNEAQLALGNTTSPITQLTQMVIATPITYIINMKDSFVYTGLPCFKTDTKILTMKGYVPIQALKKGDWVKTLLHGFKRIEMLGYSIFYHPGTPDRRVDQLYVCRPAQYPEVFEDLVVTGSHAILVEEFADDAQRTKTQEVLKDIYLTDNKYRLPACADNRSAVYEKKGTYAIYHLALAHDNYYMNYGIFANGLLVETCSRRYLKECSGMTLV